MRISSLNRLWKNSCTSVFLLPLLLLLLTACEAAETPYVVPTLVVSPTPQPIPTRAIVTTTSPAGFEGTATPLATAPPALVLRGDNQVSVVCPSNALRLTLTIDDQPVAAATRIAALGDELYITANGGLYRLPRLSADAQVSALEPLLPRGGSVAGRVVQEITDLAVDPGGGQLYALDKAGHLYNVPVGGGGPTLVYRARPTDDDLSPQMAALTVDGQGRPLLMDTALGTLWAPERIESLEVVNETLSITNAADTAALGGRVFLLGRDGAMRVITGALGSSAWHYLPDLGLGMSLFTSDHLGIDVLYVLDGEARTLTGFAAGDGQPISRYVFSFPGIGLLRDALFTGGRLYTLADGDLLIYPGPASDVDSADCPPPAAGTFARPRLYGQDVIAELARFSPPIKGWTLPVWPRVYPGASRIYRMGVHQGLDIYQWNGPRGFGLGWPVVAAASGEVVRATVSYEEMSAEEFERLVQVSDAAGATSQEDLQRFAGKQVIIDHGNGIRTVYSHLNTLAPGIREGEQVWIGQEIGTVGVSGTQGESVPGAASPHLHFELWIGDRYLGEGLTINETMWWFTQIYGE